jgi:FlaA1/EpsC-like NDP-sugar epimerase
MGEPVLILELAKRMIELSGFRRAGEIDIEFTGMRPGEKLFEKLQYGSEETARRATRRSSSARSRGAVGRARGGAQTAA